MNPWGVASLDPRGIVGRIYLGDHITLLHTKSVSSGSHGFREEDFRKFFRYTALCKHMTSWGVVSLDPRSLIGRIYVGDH